MDEEYSFGDDGFDDASDSVDADDEISEGPDSVENDLSEGTDSIETDLPEIEDRAEADISADVEMSPDSSEVEDLSLYEDTEEADLDIPSVLHRDEEDLLETGARNIADILDVRKDDLLDKGWDNESIEEQLAQEKRELESEFVHDAFYYGQNPDIEEESDAQDIEDTEGSSDDIPADAEQGSSREYNDYDEDLTDADLGTETYIPADYSEKVSELSEPESDDLYSQTEEAELDLPKVLQRDEEDLLETGARNIEDILDVRRDDLIDKGWDEEAIEEQLSEEKKELENEFIHDAFNYGQDLRSDERQDVQEPEDIPVPDENAAEIVDSEPDVIEELPEEYADTEQDISENTENTEVDLQEAADSISQEEEDLYDSADEADPGFSGEIDNEGELTETDNLEISDLPEEDQQSEDISSQDGNTGITDIEIQDDTDNDLNDEIDEAGPDYEDENSDITLTDTEEGQSEDLAEEPLDSFDYSEQEEDLISPDGNANDNEIDSDLLMREILEQNVEDSVLPVNGGEWSDPEMPGDSMWIPDDEKEFSWQKGGETHVMTGEEFKDAYDVEGVEYHHNEPDFSPFEDPLIGSVELDEMPTNRNESYNAAAEAAAEKLGMTVDEIQDYMDENGLTWHEMGNRSTVEAIPTEVNSMFRHTGGIGMQKNMDAFAEGLSRITDGNGVSLQREGYEGATVEGLEEAIDNLHEYYRDIKREQKGQK